MIHFYDKIFFIGLAALPLLAFIYFLFMHAKPKTVSSLILWEDQFKSRQSGLRIKRLPLPFTFLLELLVLVLLVLAAATPLLLRKEAGSITVILDNSYSMQAGRPSAKEKALKKVNSLLDEFDGRSFNLILAGTTARNLGSFKNKTEFRDALKRWNCDEANSLLDTAMAFAQKLEKNNDRTFLLTDQQPGKKKLPDNFTWTAFGKKTHNMAIINAARSSSGNDHCMALIANISDKASRTTVLLSFTEKDSLKKISRDIELKPGEQKKLSFQLPAATGNVLISLPPDDLEIDDSVTLLPGKNNVLRTAVYLKDKKYADLLKKALASTGKTAFGLPDPQLVITESDMPDQENRLTKVIIINDKKSRTLAGPYTVDRRHPVTDGLNLKGVLWAESPDTDLPGLPLITAGNKFLLTIEEHSGNKSDIYLNLFFAGSTLQNTPNWPVLLWNIAEWTISRLPGTKYRNYRLGEKISMNLPPETKNIEVTTPDGTKTERPVSKGQFTLSLDAPGKYSFKGSDFNDSVHVNTMNYDESDLSALGEGTFQGERNSAGLNKNYRNIGWIFLIAAAMILSCHWFLIRRRAD